MTHPQALFQKQYGTSQFPFGLSHFERGMTDGRSDGSDAMFYLHWHSGTEIIMIHAGQGIIVINGREISVEHGQAVFVNGGELHSGFYQKSMPCQCSAMTFNPGMLHFNTNDICQQEYITPFLHGNYRIPTHIKGEIEWEKRILTAIQDIILAYDVHEKGYELKVKILLYEILLELIRQDQYYPVEEINQYKQQATSRIKKIVSFIEDNCSSRIYIAELAELAGISKRGFFKFFKSMTGRTPIDYINSCKVNIAANLLNESDKSILDISIECGFESVGYFIKVFRKYKNCTPRTYRNM